MKVEGGWSDGTMSQEIRPQRLEEAGRGAPLAPPRGSAHTWIWDLGPPDCGSAKVCCLKLPVCGPLWCSPRTQTPSPGLSTLPLPHCGTVCRGPTRPPGPFLLDQGRQECGGYMRAPRTGLHGISTGLRQETEAEQAGMWVGTVPGTLGSPAVQSPQWAGSPQPHTACPQKGAKHGEGGGKEPRLQSPGAPRTGDMMGPSCVCSRCGQSAARPETPPGTPVPAPQQSHGPEESPASHGDTSLENNK